MPRPMHNTTGLPRQLREELGLKDNYREKRPAPIQRGPASRKERRKEERSDNRGSGKLINANQLARFQKPRDDLEDDDILDLDSGEPADSNTTFSSSKHMNPTRTEHNTKSILKSRRLLNGDGNSELKSSRTVSSTVRSKLEADEAEISQLEKKLGLKGRKQLPKSFEDDGLAHLLGEHGSDSDSDEQRKRKREGDEWLQTKRRKAQARSHPEKGRNISTGSNEDILGEFEQEDDSEFEGLDEDLENESESDEAEHTSDDEGDEEKYYDSNYGAKNVSSNEGQEAPQVKTRENPYVAPATKSNSNRNKYVPPSLRGSSELGGESQVRLRRQTQGLLNKLSEANLISILNDVETLYRENPRQNVTSIMVSLLLGLLLNPSSLSDTFVILHAGFIAAMYKVTGMDFGAEMIQNLVETFDDLESHDEATVGKKALNMMSLLSQLYNFHVIGSNLVFDYIRIFLQDITESNTELLLKIIRNSGPQLRQDDPSALKDIVLLIQPAVARIGEAALSIRTKFMIETITNLKNNRMKTGVVASTIVSEHITRMRKILGSLNTRSFRATEPIRISRSDIHDSAKKGKWWLVGASWKVDPLESARQELSSLATTIPSTVQPVEHIHESDSEPDLASIAKAHRMNTDVRRSIFVAIMSANDYRDAHIRLLKLHLKRNQEYEIPGVVVHCAMEEEEHNPYYTLIARRLCNEMGRRMKMSFAFTLWDAFKRMGERGNLDEDGGIFDDDGSGEGGSNGPNDLKIQSLVNLSKFYGALVADNTLTLAILKNLNFAYLQPKTTTFLELFFISIFQQSQLAAGKRKGSKNIRSTIDRPFTTNSKDIDEDYDENRSIEAAVNSLGINNSILRSTFLRTHETPQIVKGLMYFMRKVVAKTDLIPSKSKDRRVLSWGCSVAMEALKVVSAEVDG